MAAKRCACHEICTSGCQSAAPASRLRGRAVGELSETVATPWRDRGETVRKTGLPFACFACGSLSFSYYGSSLTKLPLKRLHRSGDPHALTQALYACRQTTSSNKGCKPHGRLEYAHLTFLPNANMHSALVHVCVV